MKAAVHTRYGTPDVVELKDIPCPEPADDEILIRVRAVAINDFDWGLISGKPYFIRLFLGLFKPRITISGCDVAGEVAKIGSKVTRWQQGDRVYGDLSGRRFGAFAEYVCCRESEVGPMPDKLSFVDAAGIPQAAVLAWQGLNGNGPLRDGQQILINGAGGGVGTYGVQLAKEHDVEVTGVDSASKLELMREMGFDHVLDYREVDFTRTGTRYDLIIDCKSFQRPGACARALKPGGAYVTVGGSMFYLALLGIAAPLYRRLANKHLKIITLQPNYGLDYFNELIEAGRLRTVVDGPYPFDTLVDRLKYYLTAEHRGKIVLTMPE